MHWLAKFFHALGTALEVASPATGTELDRQTLEATQQIRDNHLVHVQGTLETVLEKLAELSTKVNSILWVVGILLGATATAVMGWLMVHFLG